MKRHDILLSGSASNSRHQKEGNKLKDCIRDSFAIFAPVPSNFEYQFPLDNVQQI